MRVVTFLEHSDSFELAYTATVRTSMRLSLAQMRIAGRIMDKFEAKGTDKPLPPGVVLPEGEERIRTLQNTVACEITLEEAEYDLLKQMIENTPWLAHLSRKIVGLVDLLDGSKASDSN